MILKKNKTLIKIEDLATICGIEVATKTSATFAR